MSSITEMINKQFEKQVLNWLKECVKHSDKEYVLFHYLQNGKWHQLKMFYSSFDEEEECGDELSIRYVVDGCYRVCDIDNFVEKENDEIELIATEIVRLTRHYINYKEVCEECKNPFNFVSDLLKINTNKHSLIINNCEDCGSENLSNIHRLIHQGKDLEELGCDICVNVCVSKVEDDKIKYKKFVKLTCCKNEEICFDCKNECQKSDKGKCPFCRQGLKWSY
jgi:hypothetical protein